ncbi:hypothetical protein [Serratia liquefaciens]
MKTVGLLRLVTSLSLILPLVACTADKVDPAKALTQMHIVKSDDYKKRPGWDTVVRLGIDDCKIYRSGGESLFKWSGSTCDTKAIIEAVNTNAQLIPIFYAAYHEYGSYEVGTLSTFEGGARTGEEMAQILANLAMIMSNQAKVDAIYDDYESDRWSMGLNKVSKSDFKNSAASFAEKKEVFATNYQKIHADNQQRYEAESEARAKREQEKLLASERTINLVLWPTPTPEQQVIVDALNTVKFTIRNNGVAYANDRRFMSVAGLESLRNSLDMSMASCSDVGAYVGEKVFSRACVQGMATDIVMWGKTAKDRSISDRAWTAAAMDSSINYNPIKYEILFSHWTGMARVYASRGY